MLYSILEFLSGLGVFLVGVKLLSGGLEKLSSAGMQKSINKFTKNIFGGTFLGTAITLATQSSMASIIMVMSFSSAGVITLLQAMGVIFGCNIGTALTTVIVGFGSFSFSKFLAVLGIIGFLIAQLSKNTTLKNFGTMLAGFGLLFAGLSLVSGATSAFKESQTFLSFFSSMNNPLLYLVFGMLITIVTHSSTATIAMLVALIGTTGFGDIISLESAAFAIYGCNIGTALTTLSVSLSSSCEAKRISFAHILFNVIGAIVFSALHFTGWLKLIDLINISSGFKLILINIIFNVATAFLLIPFSKLLAKFTHFVIRDKVSVENKIYILDDNLIEVPEAAILQLNLCITDLFDKIEGILKEVNYYCTDFDKIHSKIIRSKAEEVYALNNKVIVNVIRAQSGATNEDHKQKLFIIQMTAKNFERILKNCFRILGYVKYNKDDKTFFTQKQIKHFRKNFEIVYEIITNTRIIVNNLNSGEEKKEFFMPSLNVLQKVDELDELKSVIKRQIMEDNFATDKRIERYTMFLNVINCLDQIAVNFSDVALTVTDYLTKNKEI